MQDPLEGMMANRGITAIVNVLKLDILSPRAGQHCLLNARRQRIERRFDIEVIVFRQRFEHLEVVEVALIPAANCTAGE